MYLRQPGWKLSGAISGLDLAEAALRNCRAKEFSVCGDKVAFIHSSLPPKTISEPFVTDLRVFIVASIQIAESKSRLSVCGCAGIAGWGEGDIAFLPRTRVYPVPLKHVGLYIGHFWLSNLIFVIYSPTILAYARSSRKMD